MLLAYSLKGYCCNCTLLCANRMATFNWYFSEYNCLNPSHKMKETHRISPWNKQSEEKLRAYMNEIIGMASDGIEVPKSWSSLISKYKIWGKVAWNIPKAMINLGYMKITQNNHLALVARNWEFIVDGKKVYKEAKAMRIKTLADDLTPMKSDEEREIEQLKAKLSQLQREIEEREAAFEKKNKLSKIGNEILEMFNLTVDDLKEIVSIL